MVCRCNIKEMPRKVPVKCAIVGCHGRLKMTLAEREELRRVGRENNAAAGIVCPVHVKAAFEFDDIDFAIFLAVATKCFPALAAPNAAASDSEAAKNFACAPPLR